jgi:hypothetical protein
VDSPTFAAITFRNQLIQLRACCVLSDYTQIRAQISGAKGQNVLQGDAMDKGGNTHKTIDNDGVCPVLSLPVAKGELERVKGIEPSCQLWCKVV